MVNAGMRACTAIRFGRQTPAARRQDVRTALAEGWGCGHPLAVQKELGVPWNTSKSVPNCASSFAVPMWSRAFASGDRVGFAAAPDLHIAARHAFVNRVAPDKRRGAVRPRALLEFLVHATEYLLPPEFGMPTRGVPTGPSAPPLSTMLAADEAGDSWVWPFADGSVRGMGLEPLCQRSLESPWRIP